MSSDLFLQPILPELVRQENQRRLQEIQDSNPTKKRKEVINREIIRQHKSIEKLLDAYQEGLLELDELRNRIPKLRKRSEALHSELRSLEAITADQQTFLRLAENIESFLVRLRSTADTLDVIERQKILRLVVKEILIHKETIKIRHSIPMTGTIPPSGGGAGREEIPSYLLRSGTQLGTSTNAVLTQVWISLCVYLLIAYLNFKAKLGASMQQILRVLQLNLFEQRALTDLYRPPDKQQPVSPQLLLWSQL